MSLSQFGMSPTAERPGGNVGDGTGSVRHGDGGGGHQSYRECVRYGIEQIQWHMDIDDLELEDAEE